MPVHAFAPPRGRIEIIEIESEALRGNLLRDPAVRSVAVYLPEGYDESTADYPLFVDLVGFAGSGLAHVAWKGFGESVPQRVDRLMAEGRMGPVIVALPDCFTSLGGNQYVNSAVTGHWADFLTGEMLPSIEARFRVRAQRASRAVFGKSSGGYGAMVHGMLEAKHWGALACHSGDMAFEWCYLPEMPAVLNRLSAFDNDIGTFLAHLREGRKVEGEDLHILMTLAMAATYDPAPGTAGGIRLPVDPHTCELIPERWERWLSMDPTRLVARADVQENLRSLTGLYMDCGTIDQYNLVYGARRLAGRLSALGIAHHFEEFDDDHSGIDYRMDVSLPWLFERVSR